MLLASHPVENAFAELGHSGATASTNLSGVAFHPNRNLLKVSVKQKRFSHVMAEVAAKSGVEIVIYGSDYADLTVNFDYVPLEEGLRYLLKGKNYIVFRPKDSSRALKVWVLSTTRARETSEPEDRGEPQLAAQQRQHPVVEQVAEPSTEGLALSGIVISGIVKGISEKEQLVEKLKQVKQNPAVFEILRALSLDQSPDEEEIYRALNALGTGSSDQENR